ncbi:MAG: YdiU family protein [Nitrospirae bacterium]|nr:YdiU family protein [Magnetococcales bacterium]HAT49505.1 YdiU family protein [Alphaproteobacteria bacterium]
MCLTGFRFDNSYAHLPGLMYTRHLPAQVPNPRMVIFNASLAERLGLHVADANDVRCAHLFAGNQIPPGADPLAQAYAGHQFGFFTMLGDGRAIVLGEHRTPDHRRLDIQFKGSGRTPYSRNGDGKAVLGPMLREYIISESMYALGIPTTRSLAVVTTGERIFRETEQPGAILTRVAASHLRVGTFQYMAVKGGMTGIRTLVDYALHRHFPEIRDSAHPALMLLRGVMDRQVDLIVHWMRVGFVHGVMNTDNVTISGETIDYGPCAFMDHYAHDIVFSSIDHSGRYAFGKQPEIMQWNLARFAETLLPLLHDNQDTAIEMAEETIQTFHGLFHTRWLAMMRKKIGLCDEAPDDAALVSDLLRWMQHHQTDYTQTFRTLNLDQVGPEDWFQHEDFKEWHRRWQERLTRHTTPPDISRALMRSHNPAIIPRNHIVEEVLRTASEDNTVEPLQSLLSALACPYEDRPEFASYQHPPEMRNPVYQTFCGT